MEEHKAYLLQVLRLGMVLSDPTELDGLEPEHFADPVLRDVVSELKERKKASKGRGHLGPLKDLLVEWGCDDGIKSVEDAKSAIRDRVESVGLFMRAVERLDRIVKVSIDGRGMSNTELRRFAESVRS